MIFPSRVAKNCWSSDRTFKKSNSQGTRSPSSLMGEVPLFRNELIYKYTKRDFRVELGYYESVFHKDHQLQKD